MQGFSRYDAMIRLTRSIRYTHLRSCGHLTFVGSPLEQSLTLVGWPSLTLWVESSDADADIFAYLEDQDPETGKARYGCRPGCMSQAYSRTICWAFSEFQQPMPITHVESLLYDKAHLG